MATLTSNFAMTAFVNRCSSVVAATSDPNFPASNLMLPRLSDRARSPAGTISGWTIDVALLNAAGTGAPTDVDGVQLVGVGLVSKTLQVRFQLSTLVGAGGTVLADSGTVSAFDYTFAPPLDHVPPWGRSVAWFPGATVSGAAFLRVTATDTANTAGQIEIGDVFAGPLWQPGRNFKEDWRQEDRPSGPPGTEKIMRGHRLTFPVVSDAEAAQLLSTFRALKLTGRLYVCPRPLYTPGWLGENWYGVVKSYNWTPVPKTIGWRAIQVTFEEVDD